MKPRFVIVFGILLAAAAPTAAQDTGVTVIRDARQADLDAITRDIALSRERLAELKREIDDLEKDRATLNQSLIDAGGEVHKLEAVIDRSESRLTALLIDEDKLRVSLADRRAVLADVLAALQRMGYRPPPAILVRAEDALASVRSAIMLGAVVPELRAVADELATDLERLTSLRAEQEAERDRLRTNATALIEGRTRIALLLAEKRRQRAASLAALVDEERRVADLAKQATDLRDLIDRMESGITAAASASAAAERAAVAARDRAAGRPPQSLGSADRLAPTVAFADAKGLLPMPASGRMTRTFGEADGLGGTAEGISLATRPAAQVSSPTDGWVVYAGPFRSYGHLLIINTGDGYHVLLAGMERVDAQIGQFVLAGEPVAAMASLRLASVGDADVVANEPVLYIEFRKDGTSIDPSPWWAGSNLAEVGG